VVVSSVTGAVDRGLVGCSVSLASLQHLATFGDEGVSGDEGGGVGAQPDDGGGDLLGSAHASDGFLGDDPVPAFVGAFGEAVHHLGVDDAGADGVDPDVRPGVVEGGVLSQPDDAVFGGGVGGPAAEDLDPGAGGKSASLGRRYRRGVGRDAPAPDAKGKP